EALWSRHKAPGTDVASPDLRSGADIPGDGRRSCHWSYVSPGSTGQFEPTNSLYEPVRNAARASRRPANHLGIDTSVDVASGERESHGPCLPTAVGLHGGGESCCASAFRDVVRVGEEDPHGFLDLVVGDGNDVLGLPQDDRQGF